MATPSPMSLTASASWPASFPNIPMPGSAPNGYGLRQPAGPAGRLRYRPRRGQPAASARDAAGNLRAAWLSPQEIATAPLPAKGVAWSASADSRLPHLPPPR
jgi:hypothetical protein